MPQNCKVNDRCEVECHVPPGKKYILSTRSKFIPHALIEDLKRCRVCSNDDVETDYLQTQLQMSDDELEKWKSMVQELLRIKDVNIIRVLGAGVAGVVALICTTDPRSDLPKDGLVVKICSEPTEATRFEQEFKMQQRFAQYDLAPQPLYYHIDLHNPHFTFIVMTRLRGGVLDHLFEFKLRRSFIRHIVELVRQLLEKCCVLNLVHGDMHWNNIGYDDSKEFKLQLIDFGRSTNGPCQEKMEYAQLIRTTFPFHEDDSETKVQNFTYARELLIAIFRQKFGLPRFKFGFPRFNIHSSSDWDDYYGQQLNPYVKKAFGFST